MKDTKRDTSHQTPEWHLVQIRQMAAYLRQHPTDKLMQGIFKSHCDAYHDKVAV